MAQTKRKRKHRGTQAGTVERARGSAAKPRTKEQSRAVARQRRLERLDQPPTWRSSINRAAIAAVVFGVLAVLFLKTPVAGGVVLTLFVFLVYIPLGYLTDTAIYRFRQRRKRAAR